MQASSSRPDLVLALFAIGERPDFAGLHTVVDAIEHANVPKQTVIYAANLRTQPADRRRHQRRALGDLCADLQHHAEGSRGPYAGRNLSPGDLDKLDPRYGGPIPLRTSTRPLPRSDYLNWGRELGFRFQDTLRHSGAPISTTWARAQPRRIGPERFVRARVSLVPVAGFAQFNLTGRNARPAVMRAAIEGAASPFPT